MRRNWSLIGLAALLAARIVAAQPEVQAPALPDAAAGTQAGPKWSASLEAYGYLQQADGDFFYYWSELGWKSTPWLTPGLASQRTRLYESELSIDRGLFVALRWEPVTPKAYGHNLDGEAPFGIVALAVDF